jgi:N-acetylglucosaminyldiphosphoundecaprenol N-acetyl-beta-D-mannosaminyltransferase
MEKIDVAGLKVDSITKQELLNKISDRLQADEKTFITTPYSEFLYYSLKNPKLLAMLNRGDISLPDGIGLFWAAKFLQMPFTAKSYYGKILQAFWQMVYSGASILLYPQFIRSAFKEKISGSNLVWDLATLAAEQNKSIYLLGGFEDTPKLAAEKLSSYMVTIRGRKGLPYEKKVIAGYSSKNFDDPTIIDDIKKANPDFLFVAFGPIKQEQWIADHMQELPCKLFIGLGGTFDYIAGKRSSPPAFIRSIGLEWLYRLITQPHRFKRILNAVPGLIFRLIKYKVQISLPYRKNVVSIILNKDNKVFVGLRKPDGLERNNNHWMFPQGGLEKNEDIIAGARREIYEEIGIRSVEFLKTSLSVNTYLWPQEFSKKFKGQVQSIVYFRLADENEKIKFDTYHTPEFTNYQWVDINNLTDIIHPLRKPLDTIVQEDLKDLT